MDIKQVLLIVKHNAKRCEKHLAWTTASRAKTQNTATLKHEKERNNCIIFKQKWLLQAIEWILIKLACGNLAMNRSKGIN